MKRLVTLILSVLVFVSSVSGVLLSSASALSAAQSKAYFENPDNWMLFDEAVTSIAIPLTNTWATVENSSVTVGGNTTDALKLHTLNHRAVIYLPDLKKNTEYTFSFDYYADSLCSAGYIFKDMVLFNPDFANAKIAWDYNNPNGVKEYVSYNGYYIWNDSYTSATTKWDVSATTKSAKAGEWNTYTITFNTGNYDKYATVLLSKVLDVYVKDFTLTEKAVPVEEYFATTSNWMLFDEAVTSIANPLTNTWATVENSSVTVGGNTTDALKFHALNHRAAIYLPNLKKFTEYTFSFKYYSENLGNEGYIFKDMVLFNPDFANAKIAWDYDTPNGVKEYVSHNGYYIWNDNYTSATTKWDASATTKGAKAGEWNTYTITFNTGDYESYAPVLLCKSEYVYLSDFSLVDNTTPKPEPDPDPDPEPQPEPEDYFEKPSNWIMDEYIEKTKEENATIGYSPSAWRKVSVEKSITNSSDYSLKVEANNGFTSIYLPDDLNANADYTLSFDYYFENSAIKDLGSGAMGVFDRYGIYAADAPNASFKWSTPGFINYVSYNASYVTKDFVNREWPAQTTSVKEGGKWISVNLTFNTVDFKKLAFVLQTKTDVVYLDNIKLTSGLPEEETFHNGPKEQIVVDFERDWNYIFGNNANRMEIAETTDKNGNTTKALQIYEGDYTGKGVTFINWQSVNSGTDPVFSIPVKGGQTYLFSVDVNMLEYSKENDQRLLLYADYATSTTLMQMIYYSAKDSVVGEGWKTYTFKFTVAETATVASFGLNAGEKHPEIWIDNISLTEAEPDPPFHDGKTDPVIIDFEREYEYFSGDKVNRMEIAETKGMDGKTTKALHIKKGDYSNTNQVTFVNWAAVTASTDPVFTVPVEERTPYRISVKFKIDKWTEEEIESSRLFLIYYDYNNRDTDDKGLVRGYYTELMEQGWLEYSIEFVTDLGQNNISFGINAGLSHPDIWIDDITVDAYERGIMGETDASYVEEGFNLISELNYKTSNTVKEKTVLEIPVTELNKYTFGVTASGFGKIKLTFDAEGTDIIKVISLNNQAKRYGYNLFTGREEDFVYVIFEPENGEIVYKDLTLFASRAVSFGTELGLTEKPIVPEPPTYTIKYVDADDALNGENISDDADDFDQSPQTGESNLVYVIATIAVIAGGVLLIIGRKRRLCK